MAYVCSVTLLSGLQMHCYVVINRFLCGPLNQWLMLACSAKRFLVIIADNVMISVIKLSISRWLINLLPEYVKMKTNYAEVLFSIEVMIAHTLRVFVIFLISCAILPLTIIVLPFCYTSIIAN